MEMLPWKCYWNKLTLSFPAVVSGNGYAIPYLFLAMEEAMGLAWE